MLVLGGIVTHADLERMSIDDVWDWIDSARVRKAIMDERR